MYTLHRLFTILMQVGRDVLCCVRNPWGNDKEWTGEWSDRDTSKWTESMQRTHYEMRESN